MELLLERFDQGRGKGLALVPDVKKFLDLFLQDETLCELLSPRRQVADN
jgi:hypothetical protein